eukprot:TRINITY_DN2298_c0_g1_i1.p1 TRINITY_DN2298_c0_g1~~TRINITY_DN2298_c0_g1_i1.p1  ORF type:complete len:358 (+),score=72.97 TRINITY_DN2298_c0_g1_i1:335-1408(+)
MAAMKKLVWNPFIIGFPPSLTGGNNLQVLEGGGKSRASSGAQRQIFLSMSSRTRTPRMTGSAKESYRNPDARRLSFTQQDMESEKIASVGVPEPLLVRAQQPVWIQFGSIGVIAGMVAMGMFIGNRMVEDKDKLREGGSVKRLRERNLIAPGEVAAVGNGAAVGFREVRPLTQDKIEAARNRRKKDGHWERPIYIQEGQPLPPNVDPAKVIVITHNHPFAHAKVEDTIPMDVIRRRVMQYRGVPEAQQKQWEAIQRRSQAMQAGPTRLPKDLSPSDDQNARMNDRLSDRGGVVAGDEKRQGGMGTSDKPSGAPWSAKNAQRLQQGREITGQSESPFRKEGRAGYEEGGATYNGRPIR